MSVTADGAHGRTEVTARLAFNADLFDTAMRQRGHTNDADRATAAGITKMTLSRWRRGTFTSMPRSAYQVAHAAGVTVDELFVPKTRIPTIAERVAELLAAAPPMTPEQREAVVRLLVKTPAHVGKAA